MESLGNESTWFSALHRLTKLHCMERQSEGVQVVEEVGLVASGFQFFSRLTAVFAEKVGDLFL